MSGGNSESLSAIVTVALFGEPVPYAEFADNVRITVSGPSAWGSSIGVTVTVAETAPAGIVTEVGSVW